MAKKITPPSGHERGSFVHPEDGKTYDYPSSLASYHHVGPDGKVVYSPAQLEAIAHAKAIDERQAAEVQPKNVLPAFHGYEPPAAHVRQEPPSEETTTKEEEEAERIDAVAVAVAEETSPTETTLTPTEPPPRSSFDPRT